ncbi:hypothetical protein [Rhodoferax sp. UBA5149]|uniref:hypothetical protein n=1 Tax=Rhodoferax sp. UBA5149 TaxID=1947379 RepID=UPI0025D7C571|nr:hypothetical protein [Rhodoferax sp. UBA5149]
MTSALELSCDTFRREIAPALGAAIAGLWLGVRVLQPGESMSAEMRIHVARVT